MDIQKNVELLAPAGTYECFIAALVAGADAVYMGLKDFGARRNAGNFTEEEFIKAIEEAHLRGAKVYLTVNTLFKDSEFKPLYDALINLYCAGLDGVIVQDLGVVAFIKEHFPLLPLHASTQMAITDASGAEFAKSLGMSRVVPARELSLNEIKNIYDKTGIEIECFIHGALCYSYSGKCFFSSFLGGRSGNRGLCAQPCRLEYDNKHLLSMKDLCAIEYIPDMIEAGVVSFKIEGRMKSPEYVYNVTKIYRKYIDCYYNNPKNFVVDNKDLNALVALYTRGGNCSGYLFTKNSPDMITFDNPSYASVGADNININEKDLGKIDIDIYAFIKKNQNVILRIELSNINLDVQKEFYFEYDEVPQSAINQPVSIETVKKQLSKTGATCFNVGNIEIEMDNDIFISNGQLNACRRAALDTIKDTILSYYYREKSSIKSYTVYQLKNNSCYVGTSDNMHKEPRIKVSVLSVSQLVAAYECGDIITDIIIPYSILEEIKSNIKISSVMSKNNADINVYIALPLIIRDTQKGVNGKQLLSNLFDFEKWCKHELNIDIAGVYISNYEALWLLKQSSYSKEIIGDIHMYCTNRIAVGELKNIGLSNTTSPVELSYKDLIDRDIIAEEYIIYGRMPMIVSSSCIINSTSGCKYNSKGHFLSIRDRMKADMPVYCNCRECTNVIYNSVPTSQASELKSITKLHPDALRVMFTDENNADIRNILNHLADAMKCEKDKRKIDFELCEHYTKGHFKKGVM